MRADLSRVLSQYFFKRCPKDFCAAKSKPRGNLAAPVLPLMATTQN
jgi:hypothetical protein